MKSKTEWARKFLAKTLGCDPDWGAIVRTTVLNTEHYEYLKELANKEQK